VYNAGRKSIYRERILDAVSLVLGILSIFIWPLPYGGIVVSAAGLLLGIMRQWRRKSGMAVAGIVLAGIGLILALFELKFGLLDLILRTYFQY
jgi:hypothetical protein